MVGLSDIVKADKAQFLELFKMLTWLKHIRHKLKCKHFGDSNKTKNTFRDYMRTHIGCSDPSIRIKSRKLLQFIRTIVIPDSLFLLFLLNTNTR